LPLTASWQFVVPGALVFLIFHGLPLDAIRADAPSEYFGIHVIDDQTGRGVPLVELETVNHLCWVTDSGGWVAIREPGLMGKDAYFFVRSHGYAYPPDGFGFAGVRLQLTAGQRTTVKIQRRNIAERLYRLTGEGIYRDSVLLGEPNPVAEPVGRGMVAGQDSVSALPYRGKIRWFWGDTSRMSYPLGHFGMAAAVSPPPAGEELSPDEGINLKYFVDQDGFSQPVARLGVKEGMIWADGFLTLPDPTGRERLVCHYAHMASLEKMLDHGLAVFNDDINEFERLKTLDLKDRRLFPGQAHPLRHRAGNVEYIYFGEVFPNVRVQADWQHYLDATTYETYSVVGDDGAREPPRAALTAPGQVRYTWQRGTDPIDAAGEQRLISAAQLTFEQASFLPRDVDTGDPVRMHRGSVRWNEFRQRWIMIAVQQGGSSQLGEVWYAEATDPTGPWRWAKKIVTHERYSFYNPVQHAFLDQNGGRTIYFEGTYAATFSGNAAATPRYDYNQIMYRLDLTDPRLATVRR
jgi:hypothetical protein